MPAGVSTVQVVAVGARGTGADGAQAARVAGPLTGLSPGQSLYVLVGGGGFPQNGFNGGGEDFNFPYNFGGGASDVRTLATDDPMSLASRRIVAGGTGAASQATSGGGAAGSAGQAGTAGTPASGTDSETGGAGGGAGTLTGGGAGGRGGSGGRYDYPNGNPVLGGTGSSGGNGTLGVGGRAGEPGNRYFVNSADGGPGGGGYYGGGGGGGGGLFKGGGGGGGSSLVPPGGSAPELTSDAASVTITYAAPLKATSISATSGAGQAAAVGQGFAQPLVATVRDDVAGAGVPDVLVTFTIDGPASFTGGGSTATATTGPDGRATSPQLIAGTTPGSVQVDARATGAGAVTYGEQVTPGPTDRLVLSPPASASATVPAGGTQAYTAAGYDRYNNPTGDLTAQTVFSIDPATATNGAVCTANRCGATTAGPYTVTGTYTPPPGTGTGSGTGTSATGQSTLTVTPAGATRVTATSGGGQSANPNQPFTDPLVATVTDDYGNPIPNTAVTFSVPAGAASFPGGATTIQVATAGDGTAATTLTAGTTSGPFLVTATSGTGTATFTETVLVAGPARADLKVTLAAPATTRPGSQISVSVTVANLGPSAAGKTLTAVQIPCSFKVVDTGGGTRYGTVVVFTAPSLPVNTSQTYKLTLTTQKMCRCGSTIRAGAIAGTRDPSYANNITAATIKLN